MVDDSFVLLFNAHFEDAEFHLPPARFGAEWCCELRTDEPDCDPAARFKAGDTFKVASRSLVLLRRTG